MEVEFPPPYLFWKRKRKRQVIITATPDDMKVWMSYFENDQEDLQHNLKYRLSKVNLTENCYFS